MLLTKLHIPPVSNNIVHRTVLFDKLNEGLNRKLILVSAPAGFGKTTAVCDWINQNNIPTAWYSIDKSDNDPVEFLSYIISGIQGIQKDFGQNTLKLLHSPDKPTNESFISLLINEIIEINKNFILVFDDFHLITNNEILDLVSYFLDHIPGNVHIVVLTRSDPSLQIARLRSKHQLVELRLAELGFSINDIADLFNKKLKIGLSIEDVDVLESKTEGWIAGLQLTALSMQGHEDVSGFIQSLAGDNRYIMDYLIEDVLKIQSEDIKEFLLSTSILEQFSAPLCNALLNRDDSQSILEELEKNNMFIIPLDNERNWYRYHHLFADLLKQRLLLQEKTIIHSLHSIASDWFEKNEMFDLAIEHALEMEDYNKCIQLLGSVAENMWAKGLHSALMRYGEILPDDLTKENPEFCIYYAWILIASGQLQKAEPFLSAAENKINEMHRAAKVSHENIEYYKKLSGKVSVAFAYLYSNSDNPDKIFSYCKKAQADLSEEDQIWFIWIWYSYGIAYYSQDDLIKSTEAFQKAFEYGKSSGNFNLLSNIAVRMADNEQQLGRYKSAYKKCIDLLKLLQEKGYAQLTKSEWSFAGLYSMIGATHLMWSEYDEAYKNIKLAYDLIENSGDVTLKSHVLMLYVGISYILGDKIETEKVSRELEDIAEQYELSPYLKSSFLSWKVYSLVEANQLDEAYDLFIENGLTLDGKKSPVNDNAYSMFARLLLKQEKYDDAHKLLLELYSLAKAGGRTERLVDLEMIYASLYKRQGDYDKALAKLMKAIELAAPENLIMFIVYYADHYDDLYEEALKLHASGKTNISNEFMNNFKQAIEKRNRIKNSQVESDLSSRELEILKLINEDLSNQEIAEKSFISLNTVKTHLKNINLKLDVSNRKQAVEKAKKLNLL